MSPLVSWIVAPAAVIGFIVIAFLIIFFLAKVEDWIRARLYDRKRRKHLAEAQVKVYARLEACEFRKTHLADGTPVYIRVNLITPARPAKMEGQGI